MPKNFVSIERRRSRKSRSPKNQRFSAHVWFRKFDDDIAEIDPLAQFHLDAVDCVGSPAAGFDDVEPLQKAIPLRLGEGKRVLAANWNIRIDEPAVAAGWDIVVGARLEAPIQDRYSETGSPPRTCRPSRRGARSVWRKAQFQVNSRGLLPGFKSKYLPSFRSRSRIQTRRASSRCRPLTSAVESMTGSHPLTSALWMFSPKQPGAGRPAGSMSVRPTDSPVRERNRTTPSGRRPAD